jgi:hypothetical protein
MPRTPGGWDSERLKFMPETNTPAGTPVWMSPHGPMMRLVTPAQIERSQGDTISLPPGGPTYDCINCTHEDHGHGRWFADGNVGPFCDTCWDLLTKRWIGSKPFSKPARMNGWMAWSSRRVAGAYAWRPGSVIYGSAGW